jgi:hypothetical protein
MTQNRHLLFWFFRWEVSLFAEMGFVFSLEFALQISGFRGIISEVILWAQILG